MHEQSPQPIGNDEEATAEYQVDAHALLHRVDDDEPTVRVPHLDASLLALAADRISVPFTAQVVAAAPAVEDAYDVELDFDHVVDGDADSPIDVRGHADPAYAVASDVALRRARRDMERQATGAVSEDPSGVAPLSGPIDRARS